MKKMILAVGNYQIHQAIQTKIPIATCCAEIYQREQLAQAVMQHQPNVLIVAEILEGNLNLPQLLIQLKSQLPHLRILYLAGNLEINNLAHRQRVQALVRAGIYDIHTMSHVSLSIFREFLGSDSGSVEDLREWLDETVRPTPESKPFTPPPTANSHSSLSPGSPVFSPYPEYGSVSSSTPKAIEQKKPMPPSTIQSLSRTSVSDYIHEDQVKVLSQQMLNTLNADVHNENIISNLFIVSSIKPGTVRKHYKSMTRHC